MQQHKNSFILLNLTVALLFSSNCFAEGISASNGMQFCDYLFIDGGYAVHKKSEYLVYESKSKDRLVAKVDVEQLSEVKLKVKGISNHEGINVVIKANDLSKLTGIILNDGSFGRPTMCGKIAFLSAKKQGKIIFKKNVNPKTL